MPNVNISYWTDIVLTVGLKIVGAVVVWLVGRWLIGLAMRLLSVGLIREQVEPTLIRYLISFLKILLNVVLVVAILGYFGLETTSFAALLAGAGLAIGAAWAGLLSNFAAGAFLLMFRPFKVGDYILAGGVEGTVQEIGLFTTTIHTPDNVVTIVGNAKIFADNVKNYSANPYRRVELLAQLGHTVDPMEAIGRLKPMIGRIPNVIPDPAPDLKILTFNERGPVLAVRPYCNNAHYWQVYFDTNEAIRSTFAGAGYPVPEAHYVHRAA
ncbi:MAG TPA: mechanosensitive ion channel family protein [Candidatus Binatia bacterium]|nr:mechanosensitive ion channel family protein [Candidatus Binatia bacterium]